MPPRDQPLSQTQQFHDAALQERLLRMKQNAGASRRPGPQCTVERLTMSAATGLERSDIRARRNLQNRLARYERLEPQTLMELLTLPSSANKGENDFRTRLAHYMMSPADEAAKIGKLGQKDWDGLRKRIIAVISTSDLELAKKVGEEMYSIELPALGPNFALASKPKSVKEAVEWLMEAANFYKAIMAYGSEEFPACDRDAQIIADVGRIIQKKSGKLGTASQFTAMSPIHGSTLWCYESEYSNHSFMHKQEEYIEFDCLQHVEGRANNRLKNGESILPESWWPFF